MFAESKDTKEFDKSVATISRELFDLTIRERKHLIYNNR